MLASPTATLPTGEGWAFEFKWDGVRALLDVSERGVRIHSRAGNDITAGYPELVAMAADAQDALVDGEIVAFDGAVPSFEKLQSRMHVRGRAEVTRLARESPVVFVAFDLLRRLGVDLTRRPWHERRATLERWLGGDAAWTLSPVFDDGAATETVARAQDLEGVVAKRTDSVYRPGLRSEDWRKLRFVRAGDFAVIGWEAAPEHPTTLSSLVLAITTDDGLRFAGKVGSGLSGAVARRLQQDLSVTDTPTVPGVPVPIGGRRVTWVEPAIVVEVRFTAWTGDGRLRQPVFRGVRADKTVTEAIGDA